MLGRHRSAPLHAGRTQPEDVLSSVLRGKGASRGAFFLRKGGKKKKEAPLSPLLAGSGGGARRGAEGRREGLSRGPAGCPGPADSAARPRDKTKPLSLGVPSTKTSFPGKLPAEQGESYAASRPHSAARGRGQLLRGWAEAKPRPGDGGGGEGGREGRKEALRKRRRPGPRPCRTLGGGRRSERPGIGGILQSGHRWGSMEKRGPVLHIVVVGFHHKKGCQVRGGEGGWCAARLLARRRLPLVSRLSLPCAYLPARPAAAPRGRLEPLGEGGASDGGGGGEALL